VDASKNPAYLRRLATQVADFRDQLTALLTLCVFTDPLLGRGILPPVTRRDDVSDDDWVAAKGRVSQAAGRLATLPAGARVMVAVAGVGNVDPFTAWITITQPRPLLEPDDVLAACENAIGRLEAMAELADAEAPFEVDVEAMNPLVWGAARKLWNSEHYREAVAAAATAVVQHAKQLTGRTDLDEKDVWQQAFSSDPPQPGKSRLRWPGDPKNQTVRSINEGLRSYSIGVQMAVRNPAIHDPTELTPQQAAERLAAISLLAHWTEQCDLIEADE
jgi:uncharacterized protein (TIGR02391 family)